MSEPDSSHQQRPSAADLLRWDEIPSTRWTLVGRAGRAHSAGSVDARSALDELLRLYLPVLRGHLLSTRQVRPDRADDLLQGFLTDRVVERNLIAQADASRGRFRRFLLTALNRYVTDTYRRDSAAKRQPAGGSPLSLDDVGEPVGSQPAAAEQFDRLWANEVLAEVMRRTRSACKGTNRMVVWAVLESRILLPVTAGLAPVPHPELARRLNLQDAAQSASLLSAGKQLFTQVFRQVVGEYVLPGGIANPNKADHEIDEEIREVWSIFAGRRR